MDNKILSIVYTFFLGLMLALFVGLGISTFYPSPKAPEYPITLETKAIDTPEQRQKDEEFSKQMREYDSDMQTYNRNVSIISLVSAVVLLAISLAFERRNAVVANGVLLGGLFTLLYSVGRGFVSRDSKITFVVVAIGLATALYLGYRRFARTNEPPKAKLVSKKKNASS